MNITKSQERIAAIILKAMVVFALFYPIKDYYPKRNIYYTTFSIITCLAIVFLIYIGTIAGVYKIQGIFLKFYIGVVILFAISDLLINFFFHRYYWELFHQLTGFLLFLFLIIKLDKDFCKRQKIVEFLIGAAAISTLIGIITYYFDVGMIVYKAGEIIPQILKHSETSYSYEARLTYIYPHKSEAGLFFILFLGIILKYKNLFKRIWVWIISISIFCWAIFLTYSVTTIVCGIFLVGGYLLNLVPWRKLWEKYKKWCILAVCVCSCIIAFGGVLIFKYIDAKRDLSSLGNRFPIWKESMLMILDNPAGIGQKFSKVKIGSLTVDNCHNVFLIEMLRYSIPVGIFFAIALICIVVRTIWVQKLFSVVCWGSILIILNIDYSIKEYNFPFFMLCVFLLFWKLDDIKEVQKDILYLNKE